MATKPPLLVRRTAVPGKVPTVGLLNLGELVVNTHDGRLFMKKNVGGVESIVRFQATEFTWAVLDGKPTTIAGFGITDAYTKAEVDVFAAGAAGAAVAAAEAADLAVVMSLVLS
jgi:hypothetical protein